MNLPSFFSRFDKERIEAMNLRDVENWEECPAFQSIKKTYAEPLSQGAIQTFMRCPRCFLYKYRWRLRPKHEPLAVAASLGKIFHRLMELGPEGEEQVRQEVNRQVMEMEKEIERGGDLLGDIEKSIKALKMNLHKALVMVHLFWEKYPESTKRKVVAREEKVITSVSLHGLMDVPIQGILDEVFESEHTGDLWVRDYKTTSRPVEHALMGYKFSLQCRMYRLLVASRFGRAPAGFCLDYVRTPSIRFCSKDADFDAYIERCKRWYAEQGDNAIRSFAIRFNEDSLPSELGMAMVDGYFALQAPPVPRAFPRDVTRSYCMNYERPCDYYILCSTDESAWDPIIEEHFVQKPPEAEVEVV